ncbi:hypothetical protein Taro_031239 [Colocasia esculenta]|uniref:Uncharacterized protein n=1 Tax=Colocasia esculenta TaxID=4460 RepID=A0A843VW69_COLES|nr:hypothetical protein [Colocasia esculenta]
MENYVEQIAVTPGLVYVNEGVCTPVSEERRPTSPQASEKRPPLIRLKRKSGAKVLLKKAAQPAAVEEAEEGEEERVGAYTPQGPIAGRIEAVAADGASSTVAAEQTVAAGDAVTAQGSTSGGANEVMRAMEVPKGAMAPIPPFEASMEVPTQTATAGSLEAEQMAETEEGGPRGFPTVAGDQEVPPTRVPPMRFERRFLLQGRPTPSTRAELAMRRITSP